ncbi:MAG: hypothetical protein JXB04_13075, partial [Kiritimatiellae bacterium]|nr:hypothetical protein [Kiritimatiellia bacterium]
MLYDRNVSRRGLTWGLLVFVISVVAVAAQEFGAQLVPLESDVRLDYEADTNSYYRILSRNSLSEGAWSAHRIHLGTNDTEQWTDAGRLAATQWIYKIERVLLTNSLDY